MERTLERVPFQSVGLSRPLGASAPFVGTEAAGTAAARGTFHSGAIQAGKSDREPRFECRWTDSIGPGEPDAAGPAQKAIHSPR